MEKLNLDRKNLKKFGITMGTAFLLIGIYFLFRRRHFPVLAAALEVIFYLAALIRPALLKPVYIAWMRFAYVLAWINTRLILFLMFYLIFGPIGIVMRVLGIDVLDRKLKQNKDSYWLKKEQGQCKVSDYERQF
jgi:uncharacterized membrane protein